MKNHYLITLGGQEYDFYDVCDALGIDKQAQAHALKKIMYAGRRGHKNEVIDLEEAKRSIERRLEQIDKDLSYERAKDK